MLENIKLIAKRIKELREISDMSIESMAKELNVDVEQYIKYESGEAIPPVKIITALSNFYRVPYDVILEDKLNSKSTPKKDLYDTKPTKYLEVHDSAPAYIPEEDTSSYYLKSILDMLPKLVYREQLKLLEKLSGLIQKATHEKLKPKIQNTFYNQLTELNNKYHPKSNGEKWTREELYER